MSSFLLVIGANSQNATFDWQEIELSAGNTLEKMSITGNEAVIVGVSNTFLKSINGGETWDSLNILPAEFDLKDINIKNNIGYIAAGKAKLYDAFPDVYVNGFILKTTDNGVTWNVLDNPAFGTEDDPAINPKATLCYFLDFQAITIVNDTIAYCALRWQEYNLTGSITHQGVFKTKNGGENWKNISGDLLDSYITTIEFNGNVGFIGGESKLFKTSTAIDTLTDIFSAMPGGGSDYINDIDYVSESELYVITTRDSIYYSTDDGSTFSKFKLLKGGNDILKINDSTLVVAGGSNKSYISTNNGEDWSTLNIPTSVWEIGGVVNDTLFMLVKSGIYKASVAELSSGNYNFIKQELGSGNIQKLAITDTDLLIVIGNDNLFFNSENGGESWNKIKLPEIPELNEMYENIEFNDLSNVDNKAYVCIERHKFIDYPPSSDLNDVYWSGGLCFTDDNWETSKSIDIAKVGKADAEDPSKNPNHQSCNGLNPMVIELMDDGSILLGIRWFDYSTDPRSEHSRIFKSMDKGKNWASITDDYGKIIIQAMKSKGDTILFGGKETLLISENSGDTFTNLYPIIDEGEDDAMYFNSIYFGDANEFFLTTYGDSILMTTDGGSSFEVIADIKGANDFYKFDNNSWVTMGGSGKSKFTNTAGENWVDCHPGAVIFEIGGVYGEKFYALARGSIYTTSIEKLQLKTSIKEIKFDNELTVLYKPLAIELVSSEHEIERCKVYSITGKLISVAEPNNRTYELQRSNFQPGIYIMDSLIEGKRFTKKIVF